MPDLNTASLARAQSVAVEKAIAITDDDLQTLLQAALSSPLPNEDIPVSKGMIVAGRQALLHPPIDSPPVHVAVGIVYRAMEAQRRLENPDVILPAPVLGALV